MRSARVFEGDVMFIIGIGLFSAIVTFVSYLVSRSRNADPGREALSMTLVAWGSMLAGLLLSKVH